MHNKTLKWIEENEEKYKLSIDKKIENEIIVISSIKGNAANLDKQYFNAKCRINIHFDKEQYKFEPAEIRLKANSKYDMGWKDFNLTHGAMYFKKQKVIKKFRAYIKDITDLLNELNSNLCAFLHKE